MNDLTGKSVPPEDEHDAEFAAECHKNMPSHFVYVEAPDDTGRLMRLGALWQHASGTGWALRPENNQNARQIVNETGENVVMLQNCRRAALAADAFASRQCP